MEELFRLVYYTTTLEAWDAIWNLCEQQTYKYVHILMPLFLFLGKNIIFMMRKGNHELTG